ncbi:MAG: PilZ domain-containing protein [Myxococcales bacterium]|nr:PilZ domain-containing protein [Myxococcales bacterium]
MAHQPAPQQAPLQAPPQAFAPQPMAQQPAPPQAFAPQPVAAPQFAPAQQPAPQFAAPPQQQPTLAQTVALGQPQPQGMQHTLPVAPQAAPDPFAAPRGSAPAPAPAAAGGPGRPVPVLNADLGAHSPTNFYKGLSGNDVVDHGGLFVATYMIPKIGSPVRLHVSLPGGYEFDAEAIVRWARDQAGSSESALPGFGAQFTNISPEARQLIYRYVRNREPLFHDDL